MLFEKIFFFWKNIQIACFYYYENSREFLMENQNANNICKYIKDFYINFYLHTVQKILIWFRHAHFLKDEYKFLIN